MVILYRILPKAATIVRYFCRYKNNLLCFKNRPQPTPAGLQPIIIFMVLRYLCKLFANKYSVGEPTFIDRGKRKCYSVFVLKTFDEKLK